MPSLTPASPDSASITAASAAIPTRLYRDAVLLDAPVLYLPLADTSGTTAVDEMGLNNGSYVGTPALAAAGLPVGDEDAAVSLNGAGTQYVSIPDANSLDVGDVFTLECWVNLNALASQQMFSKGVGAPGLFCDSGGVLTLSKGGTGTMAQFTTGPTVGAVAYIVATKDGSTMHCYTNAVDVTSVVQNLTCIDTSTAINLGRSTGSSNYLNGLFGHFAMYDYALSADRVEDHFAAGIAAFESADTDTLTLNPA